MQNGQVVLVRTAVLGCNWSVPAGSATSCPGPLGRVRHQLEPEADGLAPHPIPGQHIVFRVDQPVAVDQACDEHGGFVQRELTPDAGPARRCRTV